ncbi:MAG: hypothetical protein ABI823_04740 [Bryobacteraceae bacterium]
MNRFHTAPALLALTAATLLAAPPATITSPGKAVSGSKELPAEIRAFCRDKGEIELTFTLTFKALSEADPFFPLGVYEGPDGKPAPVQVSYTQGGKPATANYKSAAGWFGVRNDYLLSLRPADARALVTNAADSPSLSVTIPQGAKKLAMTFPAPGQAFKKIAATCKK